MSDIGMNIATARKKAGLTQPELAALCGWSSQSRVSNYERGLREPKIDDVRKIAKAINVDIHDLISYDIVFKNEDGSNVYVQAKYSAPGMVSDHDALQYLTPSNIRPVTSSDSQDEILKNDYVFLSLLDVRLAGGNGSISHDAEEQKPQAFRRDWLQQLKFNEKDLVCMIAHGNSMEPRISENDSLLIDLNQKDIKDGKIYAIRMNHDLKVNRLFNKLNGGIRIVSDSSLKVEFPDIDVGLSELDYIEIIGRVVWVGGVV
jgi:phage repressor protein C with HTH and peptisase S24 domain/DNA-binding XRE family transcriptional regulator